MRPSRIFVGDEKKDKRQGGAEGPDVARDPLQGDTQYRRGDKKIRSVGRADKPYGECHGDDDTEVDEVNPKASDDRQEDRSEDYRRRDVVDKASHDQQDDVDDEKCQNPAVRDG